MRRSRLFLLLATITICALVVVAIRRSGSSGQALPADAVAAPAPGREASFHVTWKERTVARLAGGGAAGLADEIRGETEVDADLVLSREQTSDGGDAVKATLRDVRTLRVVVSGQTVADAALAKGIDGHPIHLVLEGGRITRVLVEKDASSVAVQLIENVARQVLVPVPRSGDVFERDEETPSGTLTTSYERRSAQRFTRRLKSATSLAGLPSRCEAPCTLGARGDGELEIEEGGPIVRLTEARALRAGAPGGPAMLETEGSIDARRVGERGVAHLATVETGALAAKAVGEVYESEADHRAALERRADGATIDTVLDGLSTAAGSGPEHLSKGWLVRSTALLELEPKLLAEVAARFDDDALGAGGRVALLDLLAATGGAKAQATLLEVLDRPAAREDDRRLAFVQRLMLVEEPQADLVRGVGERLARSRSGGQDEMAYAEAHVLGALAGRLAARGGQATADAKASVGVLASALDQAKTPPARAAYLSALGNAGDASQVGRIAKHSADAEPSVRRAVASALRKTTSPEAHATLMTLARDADADVQMAAIDSLGHHPVSSGELAQLLDTPNLGGDAEARLVTMTLRSGAPMSEMRSSLEHVLARTEDPRLQARIRFALESAPL